MHNQTQTPDVVDEHNKSEHKTTMHKLKHTHDFTKARQILQKSNTVQQHQ